MILRTTKCRLEHMRRAAWITPGSATDALERELSFVVGNGTTPVAKREGDISYQAALRLHASMMHMVYTGNDTLRRGLSSSVSGAFKDLSHAIGTYSRHPAWRGVGLLGHHPEVFPAWWTADGYSPRPLTNGRFVILAPVWHCDPAYPTERFTLWSEPTPDAAPEGRLLNAEIHEAFV